MGTNGRAGGLRAVPDNVGAYPRVRDLERPISPARPVRWQSCPRAVERSIPLQVTAEMRYRTSWPHVAKDWVSPQNVVFRRNGCVAKLKA